MSEQTDINTNDLKEKHLIPKKELEIDISENETIEIKTNDETNVETKDSNEIDLQDCTTRSTVNLENEPVLIDETLETNKEVNSSNSCSNIETDTTLSVDSSKNANVETETKDLNIENSEEKSSEETTNDNSNISNQEFEETPSSTNEVDQEKVNENVPEITHVPQSESHLTEDEIDIKSKDETLIPDNSSKTSEDATSSDNQCIQNENLDLSKDKSKSFDSEYPINDEQEEQNLVPLDNQTESSHDQTLDQSFGTENSDLQYGVHRKGETASSTDDLDRESFSEGESHDSEIDDDEEDDAERTHTEEEENEIDNENENDQEAGGDDPPKNKRLDDDEDRRNPQYIPKKGTFYEHDDRTAEDCDDPGATGDGDRKEGNTVGTASGDGIDGSGDGGRRGKVWKEKESRWHHDRYDEHEQSPKTMHELVQAYGYDIRNEDGPPRARRRRRYGRGPNKYTRNWEDEEAYGKISGGEKNVKGGERGDKIRKGGRTRERPGNGNTNPTKGEDFPPLLSGPSEVVDENKKNSTSEEPVLSATYSNRVSQDKRHTGPLTKKDFPALNVERSDNVKSLNTPSPPKPTGRVTRGRGGGSRGRGFAGPENGRIIPSGESGKGHDIKELDYDISQKRNRNPPLRGPRNNNVPRQNTETQVFTPSGRGRGTRGRGRGAFGSNDNRPHTNSEFKRNSGDYDVEDTTEAGHKSNTHSGNQQQTQIQNSQIRNTTDFRKLRKPENGTFVNQQSTENIQHRRQSGPMPPRLQQEGGANNSNSTNIPASGGGSANRPKRYSSMRQRPLPEPQPQAPPPPTQQQQQQPQQQSGYPQPPPQQPQQQAYFPAPPLPPSGGAYMAYGSPAGDTPPVLTAGPPPPPPHQGPPQYAPFIPPTAPQRLPPQFLPGQPMINYVPPQGQFQPPAFTTFQNFTQVGPSQPPELYQPQGGITYYSPEEQVMQQRSITKKRPRTAIPIVPPPERSGMGHGGSSPTVQGEQLRTGSPNQYINQQEVA